MNTLTLSVATTRENLLKLENYINSFYESLILPEYLRGKITLSIISAVKNSMLFGDSKALVQVTTHKNKEKITVTVENKGNGYDLDPNVIKKVVKELYLLMVLTDQLLFTKNGAMITMTFLLKDKILQR